ncbi:phage tail protein [Mangrovicoccus ximenensis]|uniref:phage tail tube protein n=1 Tax=Mangrovicoccus ximenensis TaxID=1911570 RepID=UPI000D39ABA9|nr:phage tail tube protein [Mangrovicoccus ximenensis]
MSDDTAELWGGTVERSADGTNGSWTPVAKVTAVTVPPVTKTFRDRTSMDSPDKVREYGTGFSDTGDVTIRQFYSSAAYAVAREDEARDGGTYYRIALDDGSVFTLLAIVTAELEGLELDADAMITISGKVSGIIGFQEAP